MDYYNNHRENLSDSIFYKPTLQELGFPSSVKATSKDEEIDAIFKAHNKEQSKSKKNTPLWGVFETTLGINH
tara:strand:- start:934 stop:1149 length:216 start_codon:yes stop_codon:yes gene_type:complete